MIVSYPNVAVVTYAALNVSTHIAINEGQSGDQATIARKWDIIGCHSSAHHIDTGWLKHIQYGQYAGHNIGKIATCREQMRDSSPEATTGGFK